MNSLLGKMGRHAAQARSAVLTVAALGSFTYAAFQAHLIAGFVVAGMSCLALDWYRDKAAQR